MAVAAFAGASALLLAASVLLAAGLRQSSFASYLLAAYLIAVAELVALAELLSPFHRVTRAGYLAGTAVMAAAAAAIWQARGRPRPPWPSLARIRELRSHPIVLFLGGAVLLALVYELVLGVTTAPNDWDSMWYHLARAAAWRQHHAVEAIANANTGLGVNASPPDAEIQMLFGLVLYGSDTFSRIPQLLAECALLVSVFGLARRVGFGHAPSAFAALLTATLSEVALQSVTTQNDLCVGAVVAAAAYFALGRTATDSALAGLAVGLALGTKLYAILALPLIGVIALAAGGLRGLARATVASATGFGAFGAFIYLRHGSNATSVTSVRAGDGSMRAQLSIVNAISTGARVLYKFIDLSGFQHLTGGLVGLAVLVLVLPMAALVVARRWAPSIVLAAVVPLAMVVLALVGYGVLRILHVPLNPPNATSVGRFSPALNLSADEGRSFFGPIGILLLWPLSLWGSVAWARRKVDRRVGALAVCLPIYAAAFAVTISYTPFNGRYFIAAVALAMPLAALVYDRLLIARTAALVGVLALVLVHAFNVWKPTGLAGSRSIWSLPVADAQTLQRPAMRPVLDRVAREVPPRAHIGVVLTGTDWSYPFYGPQLERTVTFLTGRNLPSAAAADGLSWLIVHERNPASGRLRWEVIGVGASMSDRRGAAGRRQIHGVPAASRPASRNPSDGGA